MASLILLFLTTPLMHIWSVEVKFHAFLISILGVCEWLALRSVLVPIIPWLWLSQLAATVSLNINRMIFGTDVVFFPGGRDQIVKYYLYEQTSSGLHA